MDINLTDAQRTLLLPLWGRAHLTKIGNPILGDPKAVEIVEQLSGVDFEVIQKAFSDFFNVGWITRARMFDETVQTFLKVHPRATIINLGAGLDTTFFRVDNGELNWIDLDLPDVIALRQRFIPVHPRVKGIAGSLLQPDWLAVIEAPVNETLFLSGGVLYYFTEDQVRNLFVRLSAHFPGSELVFDAVSEASIPYINKGLKATGHNDALVQWGLNNSETLAQWHPAIQVLQDYPLFSRIAYKDFWSPIIQGYMNQSDAGNSSKIIHIKFRGG